MSDTPTDPLLTTAEAAKELGVTAGTLEVWRTTRRYPLPFIKCGRLVRYRQSAIQKFLDSRTVNAEAAA